MRKIIFFCTIFLCIPMFAFAEKGGKPNDNLQQQIDELKSRVKSLEQAPTGTIGVYDANGQYLCEYTGNNGSTAIFCFIQSIGGFGGIEYPTGHYAGGTTSLYFESGDCTGQPYVKGMYRNKIIQLSTSHPTSYFQIMGASTINSWMNSYLSGEDCYPYYNQIQVFPVEEVILPFTFPVATPLRFE